jgi:hypothetical protein
MHKENLPKSKADVIELLDNGYNPFLCDKCQKHGYCMEKFYKREDNNKLVPKNINQSNNRESFKLIDKTPITDREISNIVNVRTDIKEANTKFGKKLQHAHALFHQDEFEQASYIYRDILETRNDVTEAWRGLCASLYFMGNYEEAVSACINKSSNLESSFVDRFNKECENKMVIIIVHNTLEINHFSIVL